MNKKQENRIIRKKRVRSRIFGTHEKPRLAVSVSLTHIQAQIIDDEKGITLCSANDLRLKEKMTKVKKAELVGSEIAKKANEIKIKSVVFDRGYKIYHGRVKALAEAARKSGLLF